ncbi:uncharacterized protein LOC131298576 [Rhododendron vialii]|uniref:uncharacterized protein LOC131298576 n=1 Tax=Rhododendron vialii TaxID=182163 RepID=UPI00265E129D|nr:uncharacterized protein LOC131298576 [Rhododendron vialii]
MAFTFGYDQKKNIDAAVKKLSQNFTILLFHYDGQTSEWDEFEWLKRAIHISVRKQTKWWYAKRFLHPRIVATYERLCFYEAWIGNFSSWFLEPNGGFTWQMTNKRDDSEVRYLSSRKTEERDGALIHTCHHVQHIFVEIMAPVFSRGAWHCVWHMIQCCDALDQHQCITRQPPKFENRLFV